MHRHDSLVDRERELGVGEPALRPDDDRDRRRSRCECSQRRFCRGCCNRSRTFRSQGSPAMLRAIAATSIGGTRLRPHCSQAAIAIAPPVRKTLFASLAAERELATRSHDRRHCGHAQLDGLADRVIHRVRREHRLHQRDFERRFAFDRIEPLEPRRRSSLACLDETGLIFTTRAVEQRERVPLHRAAARGPRDARPRRATRSSYRRAQERAVSQPKTAAASGGRQEVEPMGIRKRYESEPKVECIRRDVRDIGNEKHLAP